MTNNKVNYESLSHEYETTSSLMKKKMIIVDSLLPGGEFLLDVGAGTGELLAIEREKYSLLVGIDADEDSINLCKNRFNDDSKINIIRHSIGNIDENIQMNHFDAITCLDVLEHIPEPEIPAILQNLKKLLKSDGILIFSGPGFFEKIRILLGRSPTHLHSHSSYGWAKLISNSGFDVFFVSCAQFPLINNEVLRRHAHLFGKCCIIGARKKGEG